MASPYEQGVLDACWAFQMYIDGCSRESAMSDIAGFIRSETADALRQRFDEVDEMRALIETLRKRQVDDAR